MADLHYQLDGQPCAAEVFYRVACDPARHVVVEACAGAGKTWILVARMARALWLGAAPDSILAITFTKKAAGEMRQRLLEVLQVWAAADDERLRAELALRGLLDVDEAGLARARGLYDLLLHSDRAVQVRTFHSWFAQLLRNAPLEVFRQLDLPAQHELLEDDSAASLEAWPRFLAAVHRDAGLMTDYQGAVMAIGRSNTQEALMSALARRAELRLADAAGVLDQSVQTVAQVVPRFAAWSLGQDPLQAVPAFTQALWDAARALGQQGKTEVSVRNGQALEQALSASDVLTVEAVLRTKTGTPRAKGLGSHAPELLEAAQAWMDDWRDAQHQAQCLVHQGRMVRLSRVLMATYADLKRQRGWVDMNDLEAAASHLLSDGQVAAWIQQRLDQRVQHLLVDEFQDTNPLQWQALRAWLEGYAGAGGGGQGLRAFIVGDPKQSIYRFRRADPRVFAQAKDFAQVALGAQVLSCDHTRRCAQAVVQACNAVMAAIPRAGETAVTYREHSSASAAAGQVARLPLVVAEANEDVNDEVPEAVWRDSLTQPRDVAKSTAAAQEAEVLADWLHAQIATGAFAVRDVMVLARRNARLGLLHAALNQRGVPSAFAEKTPMIDAPVVADVVALLDAATAHGHDLSLARALKSPMFGATDEELMALARARQALGSVAWWSVLSSQAALEVVPRGMDRETWCARVQAWAQDLQTLDQRLRQWPVHDVLVWWFEHIQIHARYAAAMPLALQASTRAQLSAVLAHSQNLASGRFITPYDLVRDLMAADREVAWPVPAEAVRMMTVHGAKGLEAKVVVLMDTHAPPQRAQSMSVLLDWPLSEAHPSRVLFVQREQSPPLCARDVLDRETLARDAEDANLLYVAMTRAEEMLWISGHDARGDTSQSWYQRLSDAGVQEQAPSLALPDASPSLGAATQVCISVMPGPLAQGVARGWTPPSEEDETARVGQAMHALLQWHVAGQSWSESSLNSVRVSYLLSDEAWARAQDLAQAIATGEGAWAWDPAVIDTAHVEIDLAVGGALLRLDRVVRRRDTGAWWVLDFKSHHLPAEHVEWVAQVRRYAAAWQRAHPETPVHAALLGGDGRFWPIDV